MANGVNKVILLGRLGGDPEVKQTNNGGCVVNFSLATSESWKDKATGQKQERTEWHRIVAFNRLAEIVGEYTRKGSQVYVEGRLQTRKWTGQDGKDNYSTEVLISEMQMLDTRSDNQGSQGGYQQQAQQQRPQQQARQTYPATDEPDEFEDEIPF